MSALAAVESALVRIPLGAGRGGSGATEVELIHVTARDDDGATGTGFTYSLTGGGDAVQAALDGLVANTCNGADLDAWPRYWQQVFKAGARLGRGVVLPALSALDIAVWDLRATRAGLPLSRFIGAHHDTVPIYGSGRATNQMSVDELVAGQRRYVDEGYAAVKLRVGARRPDEDVARVAAVREALGPHIRIMVDANERLDLPTALWLHRRLEELDVFWFEEPLPAHDVAGHAKLAAQPGPAIAAGEHLHGRFEFANYLRAGAASVIMPDAPLAGGVTEWLRISAIAEPYGAVLTPHLLPELHIHLALAVPNCPWIEHFPLIDDVLAETVAVTDGIATPQSRPGHGMCWNRDALDRLRVR